MHYSWPWWKGVVYWRGYLQLRRGRVDHSGSSLQKTGLPWHESCARQHCGLLWIIHTLFYLSAYCMLTFHTMSLHTFNYIVSKLASRFSCSPLPWCHRPIWRSVYCLWSVNEYQLLSCWCLYCILVSIIDKMWLVGLRPVRPPPCTTLEKVDCPVSR